MVIIDIHGKSAVFAPHQRLANAIAAILQTQEECFPSDLDDSFTDAEIEKHWHLSYNLAQEEISACG